MRLSESAIAYIKPDLTAAPGIRSDRQLSVDDSPVLKSLQNGLLVSYIVDTGSHFEYVQNRHLRSEGCDEDTLHRNAVENLAKLAQEKLRVSTYQGFYAALLGGNFEASLLLVDSLWDEDLAHLVSNDFLACIPARDILAFRDSASRVGEDELRGQVGRVWSGADHLLTQSLYRRRGIRWERVDDRV
jgi:uncharacterized protein YtpQ (UPF0354 family)